MTRGLSVKTKHLRKSKRAISNIPSFLLSNTSNTNTPPISTLPNPIQSYSDKKNYRVIQLPNGLTALLIADTDSKTEKIETDEKSTPENAIQCDDNEDDDDEYSDMSDSDEDEDFEEKMAACGLCVGVGSFSDPEEIPGLAHFVEHMLFMGSQKYPKENDFDCFVKKKGGSDNASTDCEQTTYYFEIQDNHLAEAMDKFANFFVAPLMKQEAMQRERESIESEFALALPSDSNRAEQLLGSFLPKGNPIRKFCWGNSKSLSEPMGPSDPVLHTAAHNFRTRHYSAHRMTVAVQAKLPLDTLEKYVIETFGNIPSNFMPPDDFSKSCIHQNVVTPDFNAFYHVKPNEQLSEISLTWCMRSFLNEYKSKPHQYVSWIIGHEGAGSLLSYLRKRVWALELYSGNSETGIEHTSLACFYTIKLILTPEGLDHINEVIDAVFGYINLLKQECPNERIFNEIQSIEEIKFRFADEPQSCDNVEDLCESMQFYPPEHYLTGQYLYYEYKPELIKSVIESMTPETVNIILLAQNNVDELNYDLEEPWFGTKYKRVEIPESNILRWKNMKPLPDFHLPEPNKYISDNFDLIPMPENGTPDLYPTLVRNDPLIEVWFKPDYKFRLPSAFISINFETPLVSSSAKDHCLLSMWSSFLQQILNEKFYDADMAGYEQELCLGEKGLNLHISGFSQKITVLAEEITNIMRNYEEHLNEVLFDALKDVQSKSYHNKVLKPNKLARDLRLSILIKDYIAPLEKLKAMSAITYEEFCEIGKRFREQLHVQILVQGNLLKSSVASIVNATLANLQWKTMEEEYRPKVLCYKLQKGEKYCRVLSFNKNSVNSNVHNYYQGEVYHIKDKCIVKLLMLLMEEPMFNTLRTKEQLGYHIHCSLKLTGSIIGFTITVNGQADKHTVEYIDSRIETFLASFCDDSKNLSSGAFNSVRESLIKLNRCVDVDLKEEFVRNWSEIINREYNFNYLIAEIDQLKLLTKEDVAKWLEEHLNCGTDLPYRKLSVQIVGHANDTLEVKEISNYEYNFIKPDCDSKFIDNIKAFNGNLVLSSERIVPFDFFGDRLNDENN